MRSTLVTAAVCALIGAFLSAVICISVTPLREWTQETAVCRGADRIERDTSAGGDVRTTNGQQRPTEVFELVCFYDGGERVAEVGNDKAVLGGIGVSLLAGILLGGLPVLLSRLIRRPRTS